MSVRDFRGSCVTTNNKCKSSVLCTGSITEGSVLARTKGELICFCLYSEWKLVENKVLEGRCNEGPQEEFFFPSQWEYHPQIQDDLPRPSTGLGKIKEPNLQGQEMFLVIVGAF